MAEVSTGMYGISRAGHDKGRMYIIVKEEGDFFYLVDGKVRKLDGPKKKRKKHLQIVGTGIDKSLAEKLKSRETVCDEEIRLAIKVRAGRYKKESNSPNEARTVTQECL